MRLLIYVLIISVVLSGCIFTGGKTRAERKLARLIKKHPELVKNDSTSIDTNITVPPVDINTGFNVEPMDSAVDNLTARFNGKADGALLDTLNKGFKEILRHQLTFKKSAVTDNGDTLDINSQGGTVLIKGRITPPAVNFETKVPKTVISPPAANSWYDEMFIWFGHKFSHFGFAALGLFFLWLVFLLLRAACRRFFGK